MALDDVIALDKTSGRGGRGGRGGGGAGGRGRMNAGPRGGGRGGAGGSFRGRGNDQKIVYVTREVPVGRRGGSTGPVRNQRTHYPMVKSRKEQSSELLFPPIKGFNPYFGHDDRGEVDDYEVAAPLALTTSRPKQLTTGSKVFVSNLNPDVSVEDLEVDFVSVFWEHWFSFPNFAFFSLVLDFGFLF